MKEISNFFTAKLQTDCLKGRFGIYRQTNGASYPIIFNQLVDAEKNYEHLAQLN